MEDFLALSVEFVEFFLKHLICLLFTGDAQYCDSTRSLSNHRGPELCSLTARSVQNIKQKYHTFLTGYHLNHC
jgi:hypothetical protein